jgi:large subunit ribosomal protein L2
MILETKKPITPSQRQIVQLSRKKLSKKSTLKKYIKGMTNNSGRNNSGRITVRHKGKGHKRNYRYIDFFRTKPSTAIVLSIEYDPNRTANIASIFDISNQKFSYIIAPKNIKIGDIVKSGPSAETKNGHSLPISKIPVGSWIYNISLNPTKPAQISRAAGTFSQLTEKTLNYAKIKLSSGKQRLISTECYTAIGIVSNEFTFLTKLGKAGHARWLNKRPSRRGVAMNPIDHPHGGGEGKKSGTGRTPWNKLTRGKKTSRTKNMPITKN